MSTNVYFQSGIPGGRTSEQRVLEDLVIESLKIYGFDVYYMPRQLVKEDDLFGEDVLSKFDYAIPLEMYLKNINGYGGDGDFVRNFGIEIRDRGTFVCSRTRWDQAIAKRGLGILPGRPSEGDLLYMPATNALFEIKFVEHENPFYQLGKLYVWEMECELFLYSSEKFNTGIGPIDEIPVLQSQEVIPYALLDEQGNALITESGEPIVSAEFDISAVIEYTDNTGINAEDDDVLDFTELNPFGEITK